MIRVMLVDDQRLVREGFKMMLESAEDISVVSQCYDGAEAVERAAAIEPDVVLMDIQMPELDGIEATRRILAQHPQTRVVIVTTFDDERYFTEAIQAGALGFLLKDAGPGLLLEAVRAAHSGEALVSPSLTLRLLQQQRLQQSQLSPRPVVQHDLTERELAMVRILARGRTNTEIAEESFVSAGTVKTHLARIQNKLGLRNRVEIVAWAWENDLIEHESRPRM